jgi:hypothetical protein
MAGFVTVVYSAVVVHAHAGSVTVDGDASMEVPVDGEHLERLVVRNLLDRDLPAVGLDWTPEKFRVVEFNWTEFPAAPKDVVL